MFKGKIYMIVPKCEHLENECYIGSTMKKYISERLHEHRKDYRKYNEGRKKYMPRSKILFDKYGPYGCEIKLISEFDVSCRQELETAEYIIMNYTPNVNRIPKKHLITS